MPKFSPIQDNFSGGEFSPTFFGRVSAERYKTGLETMLNYFPTVQGAALRRSGSYYLYPTKNNGAAKLIPFVVSQTQAYQLEFGDSYIRFFQDYEPILSGGTPYEKATSYSASDLADLRYVQMTNVATVDQTLASSALLLLHPFYPPKILFRKTDTDWSFANATFIDGPYGPILNTVPLYFTAEITPSMTSGAGTLTVTTGAYRFASTDVGRLIRIKHGSTWGAARITGFTDVLTVNAVTIRNFASATASNIFRVGLWSDTSGFPATGCMYEDRLCLAGGNVEYPLQVDLSRTGNYLDFTPSETDGSIVATHALSLTLQSDQGNFLRWVDRNEKGLVGGTVASEHAIKPAQVGEALSATNVTANKTPTEYGSAAVQPVRVGTGTMFVSPTGRKVREMLYDEAEDGFRCPDRTLLSEHITGETGLKQLAVQRDPIAVMWALRNDGLLASMTYERDAELLIVGWARHQIGGVSDEDSSPAVVESISPLPSPDGKRQDLWMIVRRVFGNDFIGYTTKRYIEYLTPVFDQSFNQRDAFFVDSGLTYDNPIAITAVASGDITVTSVGHGLNDDDAVWITGIVGMKLLNDKKYYVRSATANTFKLKTVGGDSVVGSQLGTYVSGGTFRKYVSTITGLDHLNNLPLDSTFRSQLAVLADGAFQECSGGVVGGVLELDAPATTVHIGIKYTSDLKLLPFEGGSADGTSTGKTRRANRIAIKMHRTLGVKFGTEFETRQLVLEDGSFTPSEQVLNEMNEIAFRTEDDAMDQAVPLFTGLKSETIEGDYDFSNSICIRQEQPFPGMILAVAPQQNVQDRN